MSNTFVREAMFRVLGSLTRGARLAPMCAFAILQIGCGESTEISGKAVATVISEVSGEPEVSRVYVLDTGDSGYNTIESNESWDITCSVGGDAAPWFALVNRRAADRDPIPDEFIDIFIKESDGIVRDPPQETNVAVSLGVYYYTGICEVRFTKISDSPYEADIYAPICRELKARDGVPARLESARFHIKCCEDDC